MKNFEKYTTIEERTKAHRKWCKEHEKQNGECGNTDPEVEGHCVKCAFAWLDLEVEEEKPIDCPFCGSHVEIARVVGGDVVKCKCGYSTAFYDDTDVAVSEHNRICRAVNAAKESEVK